MVEENKSESIGMYLKDIDKVSSTAYEGTPSIKVLNTKSLTIGNYQAIEREEDWLAAGFTTKATYLISDDKIVIFSLLPYSDKEITQMDAYLQYDQILSTFKFL